jgi:poly-gamma-glutamate synthase PgsB/CapB
MLFILFMIIALIIYGCIEYFAHQRTAASIPIRVLVNGTRGKSSVTRLITAGLRGGGIAAMGKTTGTAPRMIFTDGSEAPITRIGRANIIEQVRMFRVAASHKPRAFVAECMAVLPPNQTIMEHQMVHSTVGVITNAREDHLDDMGPTVEDVARALANTIPARAVLFTSEKKHFSILHDTAKTRGTRIVSADGSGITDTMMRDFAYIEHKDNVGLALAVCEHLGVPRDKALAEMYRAIPDPGVLRIYKVVHYGKDIEFVNAFAANDPDSYVLIWSLLENRFEKDRKIIPIVNCRKDRIQRTESMADLVARRIRGDHFIFAGEYTLALTNRAIAQGLDPSKASDLGGYSGEDIFHKVAALTEEKSIAIGIGNIVGFGEELVNSFKSRGAEIEY